MQTELTLPYRFSNIENTEKIFFLLLISISTKADIYMYRCMRFLSAHLNSCAETRIMLFFCLVNISDERS